MKRFIYVLLLLSVFQSLFAQFYKTQEIQPDIAKEKRVNIYPRKLGVKQIQLSQTVNRLPKDDNLRNDESSFLYNPSFYEL